jgi:hypothetical protein
VDSRGYSREDYEQELRIKAWQASLKAPPGLPDENLERWVCTSVHRQTASLGRMLRARDPRLEPRDYAEHAVVRPLGRLEARGQIARLRAALQDEEWAALLGKALGNVQGHPGGALVALRVKAAGILGREYAPTAVPVRRRSVRWARPTRTRHPGWSARLAGWRLLVARVVRRVWALVAHLETTEREVRVSGAVAGPSAVGGRCCGPGPPG